VFLAWAITAADCQVRSPNPPVALQSAADELKVDCWFHVNALRKQHVRLIKTDGPCFKTAVIYV